MKITVGLVVMILGFCFGVFLPSVIAQGTFQNLNFEMANPIFAGNPYDASAVTAASAFPYWTVTYGGIPQATVEFNDVSTGAASIDLLSTSYGAVIDGNYTAFLQDGYNYANPSDSSVALSQSGTVPANAQSLQFKSDQPTISLQTLFVSFAGNNLSPVVLSSGESPSGVAYDVFGVDIAPYAGMTGELEFTSDYFAELDDITFSTMAVPEPKTLPLILLGGIMLTLYGCRNHFRFRAYPNVP